MKVRKKFIAILCYETESSTSENGSIFYISDIDFYNENFCIPDDISYSQEIYKAIESLGKDCWCGSENCFYTSEKIGGEKGLKDFLSPLPWITVISEREWEDSKKINPSRIKESILTDVYDSYEDEEDYEEDDDKYYDDNYDYTSNNYDDNYDDYNDGYYYDDYDDEDYDYDDEDIEDDD